MGYHGNPLKEKLPIYKTLSYEDIKEVYEKMIKNKTYAIGIVGKTGDMDLDKLETLGKVVKLNKNKLFSQKK